MSFCAVCGLEAAGGDRFCQRCGAQLPAAVLEQERAVAGPAAVEHAAAAPRRPDRRAGWLLAAVAVCLIAVGAVVVVLLTRPSHKANAQLSAASQATPRSPVSPVSPASRASPAGPGATPATSPSPSPSPRPSPTASPPAVDGSSPEAYQARTVDHLLDLAAPARGKVGTSVQQLQSCQIDPYAAEQALQSAIDVRTQLLSQLDTLDLSALPGGVVPGLRAAEQLSLDADESYLSWAQSLEAYPCDGSAPQTSDFADGDSYSAQATAAKASFTALWAPIAQRYGLTARQSSDL